MSTKKINNLGSPYFKKKLSKTPYKSEWFDVRSKIFSLSVRADTGSRSTTTKVMFRRLDPRDKSRWKTKGGLKRSYMLLAWSKNS